MWYAALSNEISFTIANIGIEEKLGLSFTDLYFPINFHEAKIKFISQLETIAYV